MSAPGLRVPPSVKRGGVLHGTGGFGSSASRASPPGLEAWECGTSPCSGKFCGGTCGHFSNWEGGVFPSDSASALPLRLLEVGT